MFSPARVFALGSLLSLMLVTAGRGDDKPVELNVGDKAPTFQLTDDNGKTWSSSDHFGKKWVVIY